MIPIVGISCRVGNQRPGDTAHRALKIRHQTYKPLSSSLQLRNGIVGINRKGAVMTWWQQAGVIIAILAVSGWMNRMLQEAKRTNEWLERIATDQRFGPPLK